MSKQQLNPEKICKTALGLIEQDGLEKLTMRNLAAALNVKGASLYNHVRNKAMILDLIQSHIYGQTPVVKADENWQQHLRQIANQVRQGLLNYPNLVPLFATRPTISVESLAQMEETLKALTSAGFSHHGAVIIFTNLHVYILGHLLAEVGSVPGEKDTSNEPSVLQADLSQYPTLRQAMKLRDGKSFDFDKAFQLGLDTFIYGLEQLLRSK